MTILQELEKRYQRLPGLAEPGWSLEKFGWVIVLDRTGRTADVVDINELVDGRRCPRLLAVPVAIKRTRGIAPNFFWDRTGYVLGCSSLGGKRTEDEHKAFVRMHLARLEEQDDEGLTALRRFLGSWRPKQFLEPPFTRSMLDANVMFRLDRDEIYLHQRLAARALIQASQVSDGGLPVPCLLTGSSGAAARLHPVIKGVDRAQPSGAALVSFNLDAFASFGKIVAKTHPQATRRHSSTAPLSMLFWPAAHRRVEDAQSAR